jgi:hypothetical protein
VSPTAPRREPTDAELAEIEHDQADDDDGDEVELDRAIARARETLCAPAAGDDVIDPAPEEHPAITLRRLYGK